MIYLLNFIRVKHIVKDIDVIMNKPHVFKPLIVGLSGYNPSPPPGADIPPPCSVGSEKTTKGQLLRLEGFGLNVHIIQGLFFLVIDLYRNRCIWCV